MMSFRQWCALLSIYVVYMLAGGVGFVYLEMYNEMDEREQLYELKLRVIELVSRVDNSSRDEVEDLVEDIGAECGHDFLTTRQDAPMTWSLWNSFFFCFTAITTIGFGHMAPKTPWGRVVCIAYSFLGVPLNGILVAALGEIFSSKVIKWDLRKWAKRYRSWITVAVDAFLYLVPGLFVFLAIPAVVIMLVEEWSYLDAFYYAFITLTTIGFGDYVAAWQEDQMAWVWIYKIGSMVWIIFGLGYIIMIITFIQKALKSKHVHRMERRMAAALKKHVGKVNSNVRRDIKKVRDVVGKDKRQGNSGSESESDSESESGSERGSVSKDEEGSTKHGLHPTHINRQRSSSESDITVIAKSEATGHRVWTIDEVLDIVERLLTEEDSRATQDLQNRLLYNLFCSMVFGEDGMNMEERRENAGEISVRGGRGCLGRKHAENLYQKKTRHGANENGWLDVETGLEGCLGITGENAIEMTNNGEKTGGGKPNGGIIYGGGGGGGIMGSEKTDTAGKSEVTSEEGGYVNKSYESDWDGLNSWSTPSRRSHHSVPARIKANHAKRTPIYCPNRDQQQQPGADTDRFQQIMRLLNQRRHRHHHHHRHRKHDNQHSDQVNLQSIPDDQHSDQANQHPNQDNQHPDQDNQHSDKENQHSDQNNQHSWPNYQHSEPDNQHSEQDNQHSNQNNQNSDQSLDTRPSSREEIRL